MSTYETQAADAERDELTARIAALESALAAATAARREYERKMDYWRDKAKETMAERDALRRAICDADDALGASEGVGLTYYMGSEYAESIAVINNAREVK